MTFFRSLGLFFLFLCALTGCGSSLKKMGPKSLVNKKIILEATEFKGEEVSVGKDTLMYEFGSNNSYRSHLNGKLYETGDYSFFNKSSSLEAHILLTYSTNSTLFSYKITLWFKTEDSGIWEALHPQNFSGDIKEKGTFTIVHNN